MGKGQDLYKKAKTVIPGGTMLLSKRPEMFLPDQWPAYYSKAKGCKIWDLDGKELIDVSIMGIGTNILGYSRDEIDDEVVKAVRGGNMSTLNNPQEVELAEKLIEMHPWADMVRYARTGGEANAMAIRIARAASGKDKVAICGYHGWHDWYLSANLEGNGNLAGHLLPGLDPLGVPQNLQGSVLPFNYNNIEELEVLVAQHEVGVIKMEVSRNQGPENNFLQKVRKLATDNNIVLIFDECTSGFRQTFGGLHLQYGVEPDMAMFGKALGNGYAITAVIGKKEVMEVAQKTFISSTFWTEKIGTTAALKTLEVMEKEESWKQIHQTGQEVIQQWKNIAAANSIKISVAGLPAIASYVFEDGNHLANKSFLTQEMLQKGYLASTNLYVSTAHTKEVLENYFTELNEVFLRLSKLIAAGEDVAKYVNGPLCHGGFKRLN